MYKAEFAVRVPVFLSLRSAVAKSAQQKIPFWDAIPVLGFEIKAGVLRILVIFQDRRMFLVLFLSFEIRTQTIQQQRMSTSP